MNIPSPSGNQTWLAGKSSPLRRCGNPMLYLRIPLGNVGFHKLNWERNTNTNGGQWFRVESKQIGILSNTNWVSKPKKMVVSLRHNWISEWAISGSMADMVVGDSSQIAHIPFLSGESITIRENHPLKSP